MTVCKAPLLESLKEDTLAWWAKYLRMDIRTLQKLLDGTGTIHIKTAQKIVDRINEQTGSKFELDVFFNLNELKGYEKEREVIIKNVGRVMTEDDWISVVRYMIEGKWEAFWIKDVLIFIFLVTLIVYITLFIFGVL